MNAAEADHIEGGVAVAAPKAAKEIAPWGKLITSGQFWAIGLQYFVTDYIMYVFLAWLPLYLMEAQKFSLAKMGDFRFLSVGGLMCDDIPDRFRERQAGRQPASPSIAHGPCLAPSGWSCQEWRSTWRHLPPLPA